MANRNSTHITFSWDIVDGYYSSSYISSFYIYYRQRSGYSGYSSSIYITYSNSDLIKFGASFKYTTTTTTFSTYGQYVMSVYVYRPSLTPSSVYSDEVYVEVGMWTNAGSYWCKVCNCHLVYCIYLFRSTNAYWSEHKALAISNMPQIHCE